MYNQNLKLQRFNLRRLSLIVIGAILIFSLVISPFNLDNSHAAQKKSAPKYKVVRVIDGDTIIVKSNSSKFKVRLLGVNAPESVHTVSGKNTKWGKIASNYTKKKLLGKSIKLVYGKDKYDRFGRRLAYVYIGGKMFNKMLVSTGHAKVLFFKPNDKYKKAFLELEFKAKVKGIGLWKYSKQKKSQSKTLIGVKSTKKLHRSDCSYLAKTKEENKVKLSTKDSAVKQGYQSCKVCKP